MVSGVEFSKLNPIRLRQLDDLDMYSDCFRQESYTQKYNNDDMTSLQVLTPEEYSLSSVYFLDKKGLNAGSIPFHSHTDVVNGVIVWDIVVNFSTIEPGEYVIRANFSSLEGECSLFSDKICVGNHECTVLINYENSENAQSVLFNTGVHFFLRIDGGFLPGTMTPDSRETIYVDQTVNHTIIRSTPYVIKKLCIGGDYGIPDSIGETLNCIFSCDNVLIDGILYSKKESAKWEIVQFENHNLRSWTIELIERDQSVYRACRLIRCSGSYAGWVNQVQYRVIGYDRITPIAISRNTNQLIKV